MSAQHPFSPKTFNYFANLVSKGALVNTTGRKLTRTNLFQVKKTGAHYTYPARVGGRVLKRQMVYPSTGRVKSPKTSHSPSYYMSPSPVAKPKRAKSTHGLGRGLIGLAAGAFKPRRGQYTATSYANRKHRTFQHTGLGSYVIRNGGKSLYGRKARFTHGVLIGGWAALDAIPFKIRPKRVPRK